MFDVLLIILSILFLNLSFLIFVLVLNKLKECD